MKINKDNFQLHVPVVIAMVGIISRIFISETESLLIMSGINVIGIFLAIKIIGAKTLKKMNDENIRIHKKDISNRHIISYENWFNGLYILLIILLGIYIIKFKNNKINDLITITALFFSMEDENIAEFLCEKLYNPY